jgi:hypothetical protein
MGMIPTFAALLVSFASSSDFTLAANRAKEALVPPTLDSRAVPAPSFASPPRPDRAKDTLSRWDGAGWQFAAGTGSGALGAVLGGFSGVVVARILIQDDEGWGGLGAILMGGLLGAGLGGTTATAFSVKLTSSSTYPTRSLLPAWAGSVVGGIGGALLVKLAADQSPEDVEWGIWPGFATIVTCSSLGAVLLDRISAAPAPRVSVSLWSPRPGLTGARAGLAF